MGDIVSSAEIGGKLRQFRQQAGLSQERLAEMVSVSFQQIQKYENGQTTLNVLKLQKIAKALRVPMADFFTPSPTYQVRLSEEEAQLLEAFRRIKNGELRECVVKLVGNVNKRIR